MEKLKKGIETMSKESQSALAEILELPGKASAGTILNKLLTLEGIDRLFSCTDEKDLQIIYQLAIAPNGLTISEIEKLTHSKSDSVGNSLERLKSLNLIYVMKNRRHLNNKLDKIHLFQPLIEILHPALKADIISTLKNFVEYSEANPEKKLPHTCTKDEQALIDALYSYNGIATVEELQGFSKKSSIDSELLSMEKNGIISVKHVFDYPFCSLVVMTEKTFSFFYNKSDTKKAPEIRNGFLFLNNMLRCHDIISTYGLFLTQQGDFRKVDRKRLSEACYHLTDHTGHPISGDEASQLSLYFMNMLKLVSLRKDAVFSELSYIYEDIFSPEKIIQKIIGKQKDRFESDPIYASPFRLPSKKEVEPFFQMFSKEAKVPAGKARLFYFLNSLINGNVQIGRFAESRIVIGENFNDTYRFMLLTGLCDCAKDALILTNIGIKATGIKNLEAPEREYGNIYINPDFSMVIPKDTVAPEFAYIIIAYSELIKNDVILSAKISKESILRAYKRGMSPESFAETLNAITKNSVPQNLTFLLKEWISQTLKIEISLVNLIHSSRSEFLDELQATYGENGKVFRISDNYAVIKKEILDDVIKVAEKHKAVISLVADTSE